MASCEHLKPDGQRCQAHPRAGRSFCFAHDPASRKERDAARSAGGRKSARRAAVLPMDAPNLPCRTAADAAALIEITVNQVRRGELDPKVANAVGYLVGVQLRCFEVGDLAEQVAELQQRIKGRP